MPCTSVDLGLNDMRLALPPGLGERCTSFPCCFARMRPRAKFGCAEPDRLFELPSAPIDHHVLLVDACHVECVYCRCACARMLWVAAAVCQSIVVTIATTAAAATVVDCHLETAVCFCCTANAKSSPRKSNDPFPACKLFAHAFLVHKWSMML